MSIIFHEKTKQFHLNNDYISYIIGVLPDGSLGQLYSGERIHDKEDYSYLINLEYRSMMVGLHDNEVFTQEINRMEYPSFGTGDYRAPAFMLMHENGSHVSRFEYVSHRIFPGKPALPGLPALYTEDDSEAESLEICLKDHLTGMGQYHLYTVFKDYPVIARSVRFVNGGSERVKITRAMSMALDLPDSDYVWMQFSGAWTREKRPIERLLTEGTVSIGSLRGHSSANHNPFVILKRRNTDEFKGEALGISLVYSGNFLMSAEGDTYGTLRFIAGIHPECFSWNLSPGDEFRTPEAVIAWTNEGLNDLSHTFHSLYRKRLCRGIWKEKPRPILLNNWEATYMGFNEESILKIASKGRDAGIELFVLDDGWFGKRDDDRSGLGDWYVNKDKLPGGIGGLSEKIHAMGMKFGLWFEPEMINEDSDLYRAHPDWVLSVPGRSRSVGRHQMVLDLSKNEVLEYLYERMHNIIDEGKIDYVKWDMNRTISECYSIGAEAEEQGTIYHKNVLNVYKLYEKLISDFPEILFESCASGGSRFDAGMLYYAPQTWGSDDTDAVERMKIQYGTSYGYPISSIGAHVSESPNQQTGRACSIETRAAVACFGTFGYEMDLNRLSDEEFETVKKQVIFMKEHRELLQGGRFYRLLSPYEGNYCAWMVVSEDRKRAIAACYRILAEVNPGHKRLKFTGLDPDKTYRIEGNEYFGDELMKIGLEIADIPKEGKGAEGDFVSRLWILE